MPTLVKVSGGSLYFYGPIGFAFNLRTPAFHAQLNLSDSGGFPLSPSLAPGSSYTLHGILAGSSLGTGPVDINGQVYPQLWFGGTLSFTAKPFIVPTTNPASALARVTAFKMSGNLVAYPTNPLVDIPAPVFNYNIAGSGSVSTRMTAIIGGVSRDVTSFFFSFT